VLSGSRRDSRDLIQAVTTIVDPDRGCDPHGVAVIIAAEERPYQRQQSRAAMTSISSVTLSLILEKVSA
jgi:hypothetical protein